MSGYDSVSGYGGGGGGGGAQEGGPAQPGMWGEGAQSLAAGGPGWPAGPGERLAGTEEQLKLNDSVNHFYLGLPLPPLPEDPTPHDSPAGPWGPPGGGGGLETQRTPQSAHQYRGEHTHTWSGGPTTRSAPARGGAPGSGKGGSGRASASAAGLDPYDPYDTEAAAAADPLYDGSYDDAPCYTGLTLAACLGDLDMVRALLALGADPNAVPAVATARTRVISPLAAAAERGHLAVVAELLGAGARPLAKRAGEPHRADACVREARELLHNLLSADLHPACYGCPVVKALITFKWRSLARYVLMFLLLDHLVYMALF
ncbi:hypothetical protein TSOC_014551, partial [Tetrabaena socialis]